MKTFDKKNVLTEQFIKINDKNNNLNFINKKGELKYPSFIKYDELGDEINWLAIASSENNLDLKSNFIKEDWSKLFKNDINEFNIYTFINWISLVLKFNGKANFLDLEWKEIFEKDIESQELESFIYWDNNIDDCILWYPESKAFVENKNTIKIFNIWWEIEIKTDFIMKPWTRVEKFINNYAVIRNLEALTNIVTLDWKLLFKDWMKWEVKVIENGIWKVKFYDWTEWYINIKGEITKYKSSL